MGPGQAQRAAVAMLMAMVFAPRTQKVPSGVAQERYGQEGNAGLRRASSDRPWAAGTVMAHLPWAETAGGWRGRRGRRAAGGAEQSRAVSTTAVIGGGRDPGGAGGPRRPFNVDRSITAVDHPAIGAHIGARKHGSQIERPYWVDRA